MGVIFESQIEQEVKPLGFEIYNFNENVNNEVLFQQSLDEILLSMLSLLKIRVAKDNDILSIKNLLDSYVKTSIVLERSLDQIKKDLAYTYVAVSGSTILAVMNFIFFDENLCEVRGFVVDKNFQKHGIGRRLIQFALQDLRKRNPNAKRVFALTYVDSFFKSVGFHVTQKENFPQKIYEVCQFCNKKDDCKEIAMELLYE